MFKALRAYTTAITFLFEKQLSWFLFFPLIITIIVITSGFALTSFITDYLSGILNEWLNSSGWLPDWSAILQNILYWLLWIVLRIMLYFALAFVGGSLILLLMAPVLTWLSERVARAMGLETPAFHLGKFARDLTRAAVLVLRNGLIQLVLTMGCFILGFIPVIGVAAPFILIAINAYYYGFNFMDYSLERKQYSIRQSNRYVWKNRNLCTGIGTPFALWMLIPFIGPITSGFVAIFATVAATLVSEGPATVDALHLHQDKILE